MVNNKAFDAGISGLASEGVDARSISERLIAAGTALARAVGHNPETNAHGMQCPKLSRAVPCTCGAGAQQAKALDDWQHLMVELKDA